MNNNSWKNYQINTMNIKPRAISIRALKLLNDFKGNAIDLGCGSGNDTVYLIKKGWNVLAIDNEPYGFDNIRMKIDNKISRLKTLSCSFEKLPKLPKVNLVIANYSIPFCIPNEFYKLWENIKNSIKNDGMFAGNFFGKNDEWATDDKMTFIELEEIYILFKDFNVLYFKEIEKDEKTALGQMKHWHIFEIIAVKKS